jgi:hypothetical protein
LHLRKRPRFSVFFAFGRNFSTIYTGLILAFSGSFLKSKLQIPRFLDSYGTFLFDYLPIA